MWKLYSFAELRNVAKVGDKVRAAKGKSGGCDELKSDGSNTETITALGKTWFSISDCVHDFYDYFYLELWVPDTEKTWDTLQCGDEVMDEDGEKRTVQGILGEIVFLSYSYLEKNGDDELSVVAYQTKYQLKKNGYTIVQDKKPREVTMDEVREKFGEDVIIKG